MGLNNMIRLVAANNDLDASKIIRMMNEEETILQMELLWHDFFMYKDSITDKPSVVYKRKDKDYGVITSE